jgi:glucose/arabinose dehydrogenase
MPHNAAARRLPWVVVLAVSAALGACTTQPTGGPVTAPRLSTTPAVSTTPTTSAAATSAPGSATSATSATSPVPATPQTLATRLDVPWAIAFLPDGSALVTLRDRAQLLHIRAGRPPVTLGTIAGVVPGGEGGLLGVAVSPTYLTDHRIFLYYTAAQDNRVVRLTFDGTTAGPQQPILTGIHKAAIHNGGRLKFGPDGYLYVTTGDAAGGAVAQDRNSLNGKILRITQDGRPAPGNPFGTVVWSYGHRNVQGIAWGPDGTMYASEFGQNTWDELNVIRPGQNYGWPVVEGRAGRPQFVDPILQWPPSEASPSGIAYADGAIWMAALRGQSLWRIPVSGGRAGTPQRLLDGTYGRLRDAVLAPDGRLWVLTDNTFRGTPGPTDDRLIALPLQTLR